MKQKTLFILLPVPVWLASFVFVILTQLKNGQLITYPYFTLNETLILSIWFTANFSLFYAFLVPIFLDKSRVKHFIVLTLAFLIISPILVVFALKFNKIIFSFPGSNTITTWGLLGGVFGSVITGGTGVSIRILINWFNEKQNKIELENKNLETELKLLRAKLNPHFLFNTINNIDTLIGEDPEKASALLSKLSDLLRYVLYNTENNETELGDDIRIIEKYIELQKIRISNPENIHLKIDCDNPQLKILPMLFLPFIENAFKHSDLNKQDQNISIELTCCKGSIQFICRNNFTINDKPEGIGLQLIKRRLELLYPEKSDLKINITGDTYKVNLSININED